MIDEYLNTVLEDGDSAVLVFAIGHISKKIGMSRPSLYKVLSEGAKPKFWAIIKVLKAIGGQINVKPISALKTPNSGFAICTYTYNK